MTNDKTTPTRTADILDQLTVRVLLARGHATNLDPEVVTRVMSEHGGLSGRGSGASFQRVAAAVITFSRSFGLPDSWDLAGANVNAGLIAWHQGKSDTLIIDRLCGRGLTSFPGLDTLPAADTGTYLRLCDLTHPEDSRTLRFENGLWCPATLKTVVGSAAVPA